MKSTWIFFIAFAIAGGCASTESVDMPEKMPRLIEQEPFPPMSDALLSRHSELNLRILIAEDGSVLKAELLNPSNDAAWDALASDRMKQWKFSPAIHNGKPVSMWINFHAHVKCETPVYIGLAEIECESASVADSVYALLRAGRDFGLLVSNFSIAKSKGNRGDLGQVDISRYGESVKQVLAGLKENTFTEPLPMGEHYVIFKRLSADVRFE
jgi:TonB family protein